MWNALNALHSDDCKLNFDTDPIEAFIQHSLLYEVSNLLLIAPSVRSIDIWFVH